MKKLKNSVVGILGVIAIFASQVNSDAQVTNNYPCNIIPGPVSFVPGAPGGGGTGWFPDDRFAAIGGGPESINCLSWWMYRHQGNSLDSSVQSPNAEWIGGGPYGSGDYRGYWIETVYRPTDYHVSGSANLQLFADNNTSLPATASLLIGATVTSCGPNPGTVASTTGWPSPGPGTPFTITINTSYLIGFCHVEDYSSSGNSNNDRTIYSFDNGIHWVKGPWVNYGGGAVITTVDGTGKYSPTGTPALVGVESPNINITTDLQAAITGTSTEPIYGGGNVSSGGLTYNRYLQQWVSFYGTSDAWPQVNAGVVATGDLINWYKTLPTGGFMYSFPQLGSVGEQSGKYPTVIGGYPSSQSPGKALTMECGQLAWLYNNSGGLAGRAISFIKVQNQGVTWNGSVDSNLSTVGNWALTPGFTGTFTGFADEQNSLTFSGTGATLTNDLPCATLRVRGITYSPTAGSYTLQGTTPLSMEAFVVNNADSYTGTVTGIRNESDSVQEIDSPINVRTAALYLETDGTGTISGGGIPSGSVLNLTGAIDLMGSGGMVVLGSGLTYLSGGINDSGYTDFSTGLPEYIAGCNEGRVVKTGTGTLVLSGTSSFTGRTDILGGVVVVESPYVLQNSVVSASSGSAGSLVLNTDATFAGLNGSDSVNLNGHTLTIGTNATLNNYSVQYTGVLNGSGSVIKTGSNTQLMGNNNTYTGGTSLQGGTLQAGSGENSFGTGAISLGNGGLNATGNLVVNNAITLSGASVINTNLNTVILNGAISGSGSLLSEGSSTSPGTGILVLNSANTFTGGLTVDNLLQISTTGGLGTGSLTLNGGTLQLTATLDIGSAALAITSVGSTIDTQGFTLTSSGAISAATGVTLTKLGTGTFNWNGNSTGFNGNIVVASGALCYSSTGTLSNGNISLDGSTLVLAPSGTGAADIYLASGTNSLTLNGAATLNLNQGSASSLVVNVGTLNMGTSALQILVPGGTSTLGNSSGVQLLVNTLAETTSGEIFSPSAVAGDPVDGNDFLTYDTTKGFSIFTGYVSESANYSQPNTASTDVAKVVNNVSLIANSYAQALEISGTNTLSLNSKTYTMNGTGGAAGVLLDNGTIEGSGSLAFGSNHGVIFIGGPSATLSSTVSGSNGVTIAGAPGTQVTLGTTNSFTGGLTIEGAKVCGSAEDSFGGSGQIITLDGQGILDTSANLYRDITVNPGGGTVEIDSSAITLEYAIGGSGPLHKTGTGTLVLAAPYNCTGPIYVDQGILQCNGGSLDTASTGQIAVAVGATCEADESATYTIPHSFLVGGTGTAGQGALLLSGGGYITGNITLTANSLIGTYSTGGMVLKGLISGANDSLTLNAGTGTLLVYSTVALGDGNLTFSGSAGSVLESSFAATQTGTTTVASGTSVELDGAINGTANMVVNGILSTADGSITTPGTLTINSGGVLITGQQTSGLASNASVLTVNGNVTLNSGGVLQSYVNNAEGISGNGESSGNGALLVMGTGTLGGTLNIYYKSTYTPASGDSIWLVLRDAADGANTPFGTIAIYPAGSTSADAVYSGSGAADGASITIHGVTGTIHYNGHNSLGLTSQANNADVYISFP